MEHLSSEDYAVLSAIADLPDATPSLSEVLSLADVDVTEHDVYSLERRGFLFVADGCVHLTMEGHGGLVGLVYRSPEDREDFACSD